MYDQKKPPAFERCCRYKEGTALSLYSTATRQPRCLAFILARCNEWSFAVKYPVAMSENYGGSERLRLTPESHVKRPVEQLSAQAKSHDFCGFAAHYRLTLR